MALVKCSECGKDVSSEVRTCPHCGFEIRKKPPVKTLGCLGLVLLGALVVKLGSGGEEVAITPESAGAARALANAPPPTPIAPVESTVVAYKRLLTRMRFVPDEMTESGRFTHREVPTTMWRTGLALEVFPDGELVLLSSYTASTWLFHSSVSLRAGARTAETATVETFDKQHYTEISGGEIAEQIRYTDQRGRAVLDLLRDSTLTSALVRFNGRQYYHDVKLSAAQLNAFREALRFADLQREIASAPGVRWQDFVREKKAR